VNRRTFTCGFAGGLVLPFLGGDEGAAKPRSLYVSSQRRQNGQHAALVFDADGNVRIEETIPDRGHDAAISSNKTKAVLFARRPGRFALVFDLTGKRQSFGFEAPTNRHFYGHGFFTPDGQLLYASENDFEKECGVLGIYDVAADYKRIGEISSGGIGPHQILLSRNQRTIVVANGGIATHPDFPRQKLNLAEMAPSLAYLDLLTGDLVDQVALPPTLNQLSIRHITEAADGSIWFGGQYEGFAGDEVPLVGRHKRGQDIELNDAPQTVYAAMNQYVGSVAASDDGERIATTGPRGGQALIWDARDGRLLNTLKIQDVGGTAPNGSGFLFSDGLGRLWRNHWHSGTHRGNAWDNHVRRI